MSLSAVNAAANNIQSMLVGDLTPDTQLTGVFEEDSDSADVDSVIGEVKASM